MDQVRNRVVLQMTDASYRNLAEVPRSSAREFPLLVPGSSARLAHVSGRGLAGFPARAVERKIDRRGSRWRAGRSGRGEPTKTPTRETQTYPDGSKDDDYHVKSLQMVRDVFEPQRHRGHRDKKNNRVNVSHFAGGGWPQPNKK